MNSNNSIRNAKVFDDQVAGHGDILAIGTRLFKPLNKREHDFFVTVKSSIPDLCPFIPAFYGIELLDNANETQKISDSRCTEGAILTDGKKNDNTHALDYSSKSYIVIENLLAAFDNPSVMDVKIGSRTYGPDCSVPKRKYLDQKCLTTTSSTLGFRLCGSRVYDNESSIQKITEKSVHRNLTDQSVGLGLRDFFFDGHVYRREVIGQTIEQLKDLIHVVSNIPGLRLWGTSLLLVYEGNEDGKTSKRAVVKMIDFCHAFFEVDICEMVEDKAMVLADSLTDDEKSWDDDGKGIDEGYLKGLKSLLLELERLLA